MFIGTDPATGNPRQLTRTFRGTKNEADTALANFVSEVVTGTATLPGLITVAQYLGRWLEQITPTRSPTTVRGYRFKIKRISGKLGNVRLDNLRVQQVDRAYQEWLTEGLDASTVHHLHRVLSAALHQAVKWGLVPVAVTERASPPPRRPHALTIPTPEVVQSLISASDDRGQPVLAAAIALATTTGLRRGELCGLQWTDIDWQRPKLYVRRSIKNDVDGRWIGALKTHQARTIALDAFTVALLREHRARAEKWAAMPA